MNDARAEPYHYVHHSEWLNMHKTLYLAFFVFLTVDTFFAQTIIQMLVLGKYYYFILCSYNDDDNVFVGK